MMISICNSNIREFGTQCPLQGAVALATGGWETWGHEKSLRGCEGSERSDSRGLGNPGPSAPYRGLSPWRLGVRKPGATKKAFAMAKAFFVVPAGHDPATP